MVNYTKYTKKELFLEAYKNKMCNISSACKAVNIGRKTYYNWLKKFPIFKQQVVEVKGSLTDMIESQLLKKIENGNQRAIEFYLINRKKDKYSKMHNIKRIKPKIVK